ncbi:DUF6355 family natural product biosynthesis protein [Allokutzneria albata]|uniref:Alpha amylase inhibitor n=1 Tax=Allokutzneria albata TaxID=211114 RepID=A0A1G9ZQY0_ALLAB|nr:DUF6355 family natural product biosynthesis protein [Allokutzneria albata]SDN23708.1 hypothetical protein SAMN04489726_5659 [Allokutzneria albata]
MKKRIVGLLAAALTVGGTLTGAMVATSATATAGPCGHWSKDKVLWMEHYYTHCGATRVYVNVTDRGGIRPSFCIDPGATEYLGTNVTYAHSDGTRC